MWRDVVGYKGIYQVSDDGQVKRIARGQGTYPGLVLKKNRRPNGYDSVELWDNSVNSRRSVHRLVAQAFIPNLENKPHVHHKNRVRHDNCVDNLEWVSYSEHLVADDREMHGESNGMSKLIEEEVLEIRDLIAACDLTLSEIADKYCVRKPTVAGIANGSLWSHLGGPVEGRRRTKKLSAEVVEFCRYLYYEKDYTQAHLAKMAGVHPNTISQAIRGETWAWL